MISYLNRKPVVLYGVLLGRDFFFYVPTSLDEAFKLTISIANKSCSHNSMNQERVSLISFDRIIEHD